MNALVLSGKPAHEFYFAGFLPNKKISRKNKLQELSGLKCTLICYESTHRILASLQDIGEVFGDREIVVARELTKKFEEVIRSTPQAIIEKFRHQKPRGEFVVII